MDVTLHDVGWSSAAPSALAQGDSDVLHKSMPPRPEFILCNAHALISIVCPDTVLQVYRLCVFAAELEVDTAISEIYFLPNSQRLRSGSLGRWD